MNFSMSPPVAPRLQVVSRDLWGARPPDTAPDIPAMVHPVRCVFFTYSTGTASCEDRESCYRVLREVQDRHMLQEGAPDIAYNFLVGGDQRVYEGRGWSKQPEPSARHPEGCGLVEIAFMGDFTNKVLPYSLAKMALELVGIGILDRYVTSTYRLKESHLKLNFDED